MITCPNCGKNNRPGARFCQHCSADLSPERELKSSPSEGQPGFLSKVVDWVMGKEEPASPQPRQRVTTPSTRRLQQPSPKLQQAPAVGDPLPDRLIPLQQGMVIAHPRDPRRRYSVVTARELDRSIYYDALDLTCAACGEAHERVPPRGSCKKCQIPLSTVLIHERRSRSNGPHPEQEVEHLLGLSAAHPNIVPHRDIVQYGERTYTVTEHPGRWGVLVRGRRQRSHDEVLGCVAQIGKVFSYLHHSGFTFSEAWRLGIENIVLTGGGTEIAVSDLNSCLPILAGDSGAARAQVNLDLVFLGRLLFFLAMGEDLTQSKIEAAPQGLRPFIERAIQGHYPSVEEMLRDFTSVPAVPVRSLKPAFGQATHPGQKHAHNEDAVVTFTFDKQQDGGAVPVGFFLVADGMGGHDAGDVASRTVNEIVTNWVLETSVLPDLRKTTRKLTTEDVPGGLLSQAIQQANQVLFRRGQSTGSDLGSTVVSALIIGNLATLASVGDSRGYLMRDGRMEQITQDHSLVARLLDAGVIGPEEVRSHPQRNQIYRCLGHKAQIEVDTFAVQLRSGDCLILCSDGLWEMVLDPEIKRIVEQTRTPQQACDALIEAANRAGGEDNIGVIVIEME